MGIALNGFITGSIYRKISISSLDLRASHRIRGSRDDPSKIRRMKKLSGVSLARWIAWAPSRFLTMCLVHTYVHFVRTYLPSHLPTQPGRVWMLTGSSHKIFRKRMRIFREILANFSISRTICPPEKRALSRGSLYMYTVEHTNEIDLLHSLLLVLRRLVRRFDSANWSATS